MVCTISSERLGWAVASQTAATLTRMVPTVPLAKGNEHFIMGRVVTIFLSSGPAEFGVF
jgi:hypothetical protein